MWTASVARLCTLETDLTVDVVTQIYLSVLSAVSYREIVAEQLDAPTRRLAAALQRGYPVAT